MKVSLEGTTTEFEELVTTLAYGIIHKTQRAPYQRVNLHTDRPGLDDVPNRYREEGVQ